MKVRAITVGAPLSADRPGDAVVPAGRAAARVADAIGGAGIEVQTVRLATPALNALPGGAPADPLAFAREVEGLARDGGFAYVSLGAVDTVAAPETEWRRLLEAMPEVVHRTESVFGSASVATAAGGINLAAARACGGVVAEIGGATADGFGNLRFAAVANCPPHIPFFPAAYHDGGADLVVGLALEGADLALDAFDGARDLEDARRRLVRKIVDGVAPLHAVVSAALASTGARFGGVDLSLAPFPAPDRSIAGAFERLGLPAFGAHGTLLAATLLTGCLRAAARRLPGGRYGFSGLMLPVLEDGVLAQRAAEGTFGVDSLLLYSAVCGLGLDTVPLPGETSPAELGAIVLDMAALAVRLDKPLTARLFPVPGKRAGDAVSWDFAFFAPSRVLPVRGTGLEGLLASSERMNAPGEDA